MLNRYQLGREEVDSLDLKSLLIIKRVKVSDSVYREFGKGYHLSPTRWLATASFFPIRLSYGWWSYRIVSNKPAE